LPGRNRFASIPSRTWLALAPLVLLCEPAYSQRGGTLPQQGATPGFGENPADITSQGPGQLISLTGRVMLEDGTVPQGHVAVVMFCGARPRAQGYADAKGYFNIQVGPFSPDGFNDASVRGNPNPGNGLPAGADPYGGARSRIGASDLIGCELRAQLAGYDSQSIDLGARQVLDNSNVGTILMRRLGPSEGTTVSASTLAAPKEARKAYEKGLESVTKNKPAEAQASFEKATKVYPGYALAWSELGKVQAAQGQFEVARSSFNQSIMADPKFVVPYVELSELEYRAHEWQPLAETSEKAIALDAFHYPEAFFLNAAAHYNLHHLDQAEQSARRAQKLDVNHQIPRIWHLLGVILTDRQDFAGASDALRDYLQFAPNAPDAADVRSQLERAEGLAKTDSKPSQ
jgi:tetratricopeptide (TPR) repeat protein